MLRKPKYVWKKDVVSSKTAFIIFYRECEE